MYWYFVEERKSKKLCSLPQVSPNKKKHGISPLKPLVSVELSRYMLKNSSYKYSED